jgi:hypothetical protein
MLLREYVAGVQPSCPTCSGPMRRYYSSRSDRAQRFDPVVLDESPDGKFSYPMSPTAPIPEGYVRRELRTFAEVDSALRRVNAVERRKIEAFVERQHANLADSESRNNSDLRSGFTYEGSDGKTVTIPPLHQLTPAGQALARYAMATMGAKRPKSFEANVTLEIREMDSSNREGHDDRKTGWRERRS